MICYLSIGVASKQLRVTESAMKKTDSFRLHIFPSQLSEKNSDSKLKANPNTLLAHPITNAHSVLNQEQLVFVTG